VLYRARGSGLGQPNTGLITIGELDPSCLEGATNSQVVSGRHACLTFNELSSPNGAQAHSRLSRKVLRAPPYQGATCPDLGAGQWPLFVRIVWHKKCRPPSGKRRYEISQGILYQPPNGFGAFWVIVLMPSPALNIRLQGGWKSQRHHRVTTRGWPTRLSPNLFI